MTAIYSGGSKMTPHTLVVPQNQSSSKEGDYMYKVRLEKIFWIPSRESND